MLWAWVDGKRVEAREAARGLPFVCPGCAAPAILKRGKVRVAHFAHAVPTDCDWDRGETPAHREAKLELADALRLRGLRAEVEHEVETPEGKRRADVLAWHPQRGEHERGGRLAFELQHTPISLEEIHARSLSYASAGIAQVWIPFIRKRVWEDGRLDESGIFCVPLYASRPLDDWTCEYDRRERESFGMWMYCPDRRRYYFAEVWPAYRWIEEQTFYQDGEEQSVGGYMKPYERYCQLTLSQPLQPSELRFRVRHRKASARLAMKWPAGPVISLEPASGAPFRFRDRCTPAPAEEPA